jgi:hypothetical protein
MFIWFHFWWSYWQMDTYFGDIKFN